MKVFNAQQKGNLNEVLQVCGFPHGPMTEKEQEERKDTLKRKSKKDLQTLAGRFM